MTFADTSHSDKNGNQNQGLHARSCANVQDLEKCHIFVCFDTLLETHSQRYLVYDKAYFATIF